MRSGATAVRSEVRCAGAIALRLGWRPRPWLVWVGIAGVATLPFAFHHEDYPGLVVGDAVLAVAAAGLVVGLEYASPAWLRRCLSVRALVTVGVLSYGIYLWHGPLMWAAADFGYSGRGPRALVALVAIAAAGVS